MGDGNIIYRLVGVMISSGVITGLIIPGLVKIARHKKLVDVPGGRGSHSNIVPNMGGFAIFVALLFSILAFLDFSGDRMFQYTFLGLTIMFLFGLKDDILVIKPLEKLIAEIVASFVLICFADVRITSFHGMLGINELNLVFSYFFTLFVMIVIINSINLIDGIDGLASGIGAITSAVFCYWFYRMGAYDMMLFSAAVFSTFFTFFFFNVINGKNKMFLGDSGSLILGFVLGFIAIRFNEVSLVAPDTAINNPPLISFGILIVPLFDTLRIFVVRLSRKRSPFSPDKRHVHHRLISLNNSHLKATLMILCFNVLFIAFLFFISNLRGWVLLLIQLSVASFFSFLPVYFVRKNKKIEIAEHEQLKK